MEESLIYCIWIYQKDTAHYKTSCENEVNSAAESEPTKDGKLLCPHCAKVISWKHVG